MTAFFFIYTCFCRCFCHLSFPPFYYDKHIKPWKALTPASANRNFQPRKKETSFVPSNMSIHRFRQDNRELIRVTIRKRGRNGGRKPRNLLRNKTAARLKPPGQRGSLHRSQLFCSPFAAKRDWRALSSCIRHSGFVPRFGTKHFFRVCSVKWS